MEATTTPRGGCWAVAARTPSGDSGVETKYVLAGVCVCRRELSATVGNNSRVSCRLWFTL